MSKDKNKEIIDEIVDKMKAHELPYREGAWERFASKNIPVVGAKKGNWKYWSAAAAVLLISGASLFLLQLETPAPQLDLAHTVQRKTAEDPIQEPLSTGGDTLLKDAISASKGSEKRFSPYADFDNAAASTSWTESAVADDRYVSELPEMHKGSLAQLDLQVVTPGTISMPVAHVKKDLYPSEKQVNVKQGVNSESTIGSRLAALSEFSNPSYTQQVNSHQAKKWELAAYVAPAASAEKVELGAGLSFAYQISSKISVRSGLSMQQLGAGADRNQNLAAVESASIAYNSATAQSANSLLSAKSVSKEFSAVSNRLLTLDMPLDFRYHINKNFYTSVGVSYVAVMNQTQNNYYVDGINESAFASNGQAVTSPENVKQTVKGHSIKTDDFNGFVNFSVGRKIQLGKKLSIAVEPFVKLPVGGLKSAELNYSNGGIKIGTNF